MHHDHSAPLAVPPGGSPDPEPISSAYFVIWGFILLFALVLALQYLGWAAFARQSDLNAGHSLNGPVAEVKAEQLKRIPSIEVGMRKVAESGQR